MKIKKRHINIYILLLSFLTVESDFAISAINNKRNASSTKNASTRLAKKVKSTSRTATVESATISDIATNTTSSNIDDIGSDINDDNCEFNYNLCMNNICKDSSIGKCVCYEDKYTNASDKKFVNINGNNVKQGFELLEYAKKQCLYILDKCMKVRRSVTEKYNNSIQRDCLMVSQTEVAKNQGLSGELEELKSCIYNYCTASNMGQEDFSMPAYGLCFDPVVAKFQLDTYCISTISKSKTPLGLRELFMNDMAKLREESCEKMNGEISTDRQKCYINVSYGENKDKIAASKKIAVGSFFTCNGKEFGTDLGVTQEYLREKRHQAMHMVSENLRAAGNIVGMTVGEDMIGTIVDTSIDMTASVANIVVDGVKLNEGHLSKEQFMANLTGELGMGSLGVIQVVSLAGQKNKEANSIKITYAGGGCAGGCSSGQGKDDDSGAGSAASKAAMGLGIAAEAIRGAKAIGDFAVTQVTDALTIENEKKGIIQHSTFENRDEGIGHVNKTSTVRGNCFVNGEWFATENEIMMLQWKL